MLINGGGMTLNPVTFQTLLIYHHICHDNSTTTNDKQQYNVITKDWSQV